MPSLAQDRSEGPAGGDPSGAKHDPYLDAEDMGDDEDGAELVYDDEGDERSMGAGDATDDVDVGLLAQIAIEYIKFGNMYQKYSLHHGFAGWLRKVACARASH